MVRVSRRIAPFALVAVKALGLAVRSEERIGDLHESDAQPHALLP